MLAGDALQALGQFRAWFPIRVHSQLFLVCPICVHLRLSSFVLRVLPWRLAKLDQRVEELSPSMFVAIEMNKVGSARDCD